MFSFFMLLAYVTLMISTGYHIVIRIIGLKRLHVIPLFAISFIVGVLVEIFLAHSLATMLLSFRIATYLSIGLLLLINIFLYSQHQTSPIERIEFSLRETILRFVGLVLALGLGLIYGLRDFYFGNPDRIHNAIYSTIANNDFYPPSAPIDVNLEMTYYHYGTDLIGATFKIITSLSSWDSQSIQMGLWVAVFFLVITSLYEYFINSYLLALYAALFTSFFTTSASYSFLFKEFTNITKTDPISFLLAWVRATWTSTGAVNTQLRLGSQNLALGITVVFLFILIIGLNQKWSKGVKAFSENSFFLYMSVFILSFGLYFVYPSLYYPIIAALSFWVGFYLLRFLFSEKNIKEENSFYLKISSALLILSYLGKIATGVGNGSSHSGIQALIFSPHSSWTNWGKPYLSYNFDISLLRTLGKSLDPVLNSYLLEIPLFSWISFVDFGDVLIVAFFITVFILVKNKFYLRKNQLEDILIFPISSFASAVACFSFIFILRPIEITRFILWAKFFALIFILIVVMRFIKSEVKYKKLFIPAIIFASLGLIPGLAAVLPNEKLNFLGNKGIEDIDKDLLRDIEKIHQSGDIALDSRLYEIGANFASLAGYYGVGGQIYKEDEITRNTALKLMSPRLLKELSVSHVLIDPQNQLTEIAKQRLNNPNLFEEYTEISNKYPGYHFYRFIVQDDELLNYDQDYKWMLGYQAGNKFYPVPDLKNNVIVAKNKSDLVEITNKMKLLYSKNQPLVAVWLKAQAIPL